MTPAQQPEHCEKCVCFEEVIQPKKYRCTWNKCFMHPRDTCICKPSHFLRTRPHTPAPNPGNVKDWYSYTDVLRMLDDARYEGARTATLAERERILRIIENIIVIYGTSTRTSAERINEYVCKELQSL